MTNTKMMNVSFFSGRKLPVLLHLLAWGILFILPIYLYASGWVHDSFFFVRYYSRTIVYLIIFYLNYFWLVPKFLFGDKKWLYFLSVISIVISLFFAADLVNEVFFSKENDRIKALISKILAENQIPRPPRSMHFFEFIFTSFLISGFSVGLRSYDRFMQHERERKELEKERLNSELAFLKNQISPHFFFNTLNNIYSLVQVNADDAQKAIHKLSKLMRYMLYESEQGKTLLSDEIAFMKNYIDLMRLRLTDKVKLNVSFPESYADIYIPPLLFVSFIENAFKHGVSYNTPSFIEISILVNPGEISFSCTNSLAQKLEDSKVNSVGIGLENIKKRLSLLYPERHSLHINQTESVFSVHVRLKTE